MAAFGACDRRQRATQTTERVEDECQTEPRLIRELWTQHPAKGIQGPVRGKPLEYFTIRIIEDLAIQANDKVIPGAAMLISI